MKKENEIMNDDPPYRFSETVLAQSLGCGFMILCMGIALALMAWAGVKL